MSQNKVSLAEAETTGLVIERVFDAPRDLVWKAWTDPARLSRWWGPAGFTMQVARLDLRSGGIFHYGMKSATGQMMWGKFVYHDVSAPERMVFISSTSDEAGNTARNPFNPAWPLQVINTLTLTEEDGKTKLTLRGGPYEATDNERQSFAENTGNVQRGFKGTFDQLENYLAKQTVFTILPGKQEILITRVFDAPRERVFKLYTDPARIGEWWGPAIYRTTVDEMEPRAGGRWRYVQQGSDGVTHGFHGVYHECLSPERLVFTFEYEGVPGHVILETVRFEDLNGKTKMIDHSVFQSLEDRDGMVQAGMEGGASELIERLAALVEGASD